MPFVINARYLLAFPSSAKRSPLAIFLNVKASIICPTSLDEIPFAEKYDTNFSNKLFRI